MEDDRLDRLERLFLAAQDFPPEQRDRFLEGACGDDELLRRELKSLLAADLQAERRSFMDTTPHALLDIPQVLDETAPVYERIGPYEILRRLGRGGMGDVYLALRNEPYRQYVALKVLRPGLDARELRRRFEIEQQILASLNHPNIARIIDGGATADGQPYIAMEYVDGKPISTYCDEHRLDVRERLRLVQTVCEAVHYAHRNLIIHRDLKPSNILVTGEGQVKLLDFGIAKLLNPGMSPVTVPLTTEFKLMTPEYASPEQVRGDALSTGADVYALGVILYELLTGSGPYVLNARTTDEIARAVVNQEPVRPSTLVRRRSESHEAVPPSGPLRHVSADRLERKLRGDLDNIVLKCLRKEPEHRYHSAGLMALDVGRYLDGLPVEARPASLAYRTRKFIRRNRAAVAAGSLAMALLIGFTISTAIQASLLEERSMQVALEANSAQAASDFIVDLFNVNNPTLASAVDTLRIADFVEMNTARVRTELDGQPLLKARVLRTLGEVNRNLARYAESAALLQEALDTQRRAGVQQSEDMARTIYQMGELAAEQGEYATAEVLHRQAMGMSIATAGPDAPLTAQIVLGLAGALEGEAKTDEAEATYRQALEIAVRAHGEEHVTTATYHRLLGKFYRTVGALDASQEHFTRARDLYALLQGTESTEYAKSIAQLALLLRLRNDYEEAVSLFRRALGIYEKNLGREHVYYAATLNDLALTYASMGEYELSERAYRETIALNERVLGERHSNTIANHLNLALLLVKEGRHEEALVYAEAALRAWRTIRPEDHWHVAVAQYALGEVLTGLGRFDEAERALLDSYQKLHEAFGRYHYQTRTAARDLQALYEAMGDTEEAERYRELATRLN